MATRTAMTDLDIYKGASVVTAEPETKAHTYRWRRIIVVVLCLGFSFVTAVSFSQRFRAIYGGTTRPDFGEIYFGVRCAMHHLDPYNADAMLRTFRDEGGTFPTDPAGSWAAPIVISNEVNLPTTLFLVAPLAFLPYSIAQVVWTLLTVFLLTIAGYLIWALGDRTGAMLSGCFVVIIMTNCEQLFTVGNVAGIAVSLCVVASWCLLKNRYIPLGVVLLALSLALKPHDSGFVWLYFLLVGGVMRKRALQTLAVVCVLGMAAAAWIAPVSPHWLSELRQNHVAVAELGSTSDPSPAGVSSGAPGAILDLQAVFSFFLRNPRAYDLASYLIVGPLIALWAWIVLRRRMTMDGAWLALAAIACLSLLPVYHRPYDAKLLLLTLPACAMLWREGGARRWLSFGLTMAGVLFTSDLFMALMVCLLRKPTVRLQVPGEKVAGLFLIPPLLLLGMACFYLWVFVRDKRAKSACLEKGSAGELMAV